VAPTSAPTSQYDLDLSWLTSFLRVEYFHESHQFLSERNHPQEAQDSFNLLNLRVGVGQPNDRWRLTFWTKNLLDEEYLQSSDDLTLGILQLREAPRTYGIELTGSLDNLPGFLRL
jgi:iron complex outermembrane receptor protein